MSYKKLKIDCANRLEVYSQKETGVDMVKGALYGMSIQMMVKLMFGRSGEITEWNPLGNSIDVLPSMFLGSIFNGAYNIYDNYNKGQILKAQLNKLGMSDLDINVISGSYDRDLFQGIGACKKALHAYSQENGEEATSALIKLLPDLEEIILGQPANNQDTQEL